MESSAFMTDNTPDLIPAPSPPTPMPAVRGWRMGDIARAALVALAVWFGLQLLWSVSSLVFLVFLATLFGLAAARGTDYLERFKIRRGIGAAIIVLGTLGLIGGGLRSIDKDVIFGSKIKVTEAQHKGPVPGRPRSAPGDTGTRPSWLRE